MYPTAIHYQSEGKWKDIDNTLINAVDEENNAVVQNKENSYRIKIAKSTQSNKLVRIQKDKYEVSWNLNNAQQSLSTVKPFDTSKLNSLSENEKKKTLTKLTSEVNFIDAAPNTDLQYIVKPEEVKENIIIKSKTDNLTYIFNINVKNLTAKLQDDKSILFYDSVDTKKEIFKIDTPFMYDASGNESLDIKVELAQNSTGYTLTLTPNQQWLNSEDRAYPVTLDPPISTSLVGSTSISDAHVSETYPTSNFGNSYMLKTGVGRHRTYVKFILPTLQSGDMVYAAYFKANLLTSNPDYRQINVHRVNSTWEESTITWGDLISYNTKIEDYQMVKDINVEYAWNITAIAKDWYNTGINNGLMLKNNDETVGYCEFVSSNTSSAYENARPQVTIYYTNNSGLEDYWTYHSQSVGRAGTGYVNDYNGNLVFVHSDLEMNENRMPVSISHVYNSNDKDTDIYFGKGWRLNLSQSIKYQNIEGIEYYIYTDEDGTKHYLKSDGTGKYKDESGLNIALTSNADGTYTIKDKKDNELIFASFAKLKSIKDNNGNVLTLNYNSSNVLESVIDGVGRKTTFELTPAGHLIGIIDPSGNRTSFSYTGVQLTDIGYPDGKHTIFNYDSSNKLKSVVNFDGYKMGYEYCSGQPYRVQDIQEYGADGSLGQTLNLKYGYNTTTFTDKSNRKNIYQFNTLGNTMSIRDDDGSAEYYKYFTDDNAAKNKLESTSRLQKTVMNYLNNHNIETSTDWVGGNWTGSTGSYSISASQSYLGKQSLMVSKTNSISRHFYGQTVYLEKGKTYTFSGYVKTDTSGISSTNKKGAALFVNYQNSSGVWQTVESSYVNGIKGWDRYEVTFTVPSDASSTMVYLRAGVGIAVGTFLSGPLLAAGMASGGFALFGGVAGALVIDYAAGSLVSIGQECIYKKYGLE